MVKINNTLKQMLVPGFLGGMIGLSSLSLNADEYELGFKAFNEAQYDEAFRLFKISSLRGDPKSQLLLSTMYRRGLGVEADEYEGFYWCKKAADEGHLEAQFQLGLMYLEGEGVTEDTYEAQVWLWAAAERGYPQASEVLTYIFSDDFGVGC